MPSSSKKSILTYISEDRLRKHLAERPIAKLMMDIFKNKKTVIDTDYLLVALYHVTGTVYTRKKVNHSLNWLVRSKQLKRIRTDIYVLYNYETEEEMRKRIFSSTFTILEEENNDCR